MRICIITASQDNCGASIIALDIAKGMAQKGHNVLCISAGDSDCIYSNDGYTVHILKNIKPNPFYHYFNPFLIMKLKKELNTFCPDIVHIHNINIQTFSLCSLLFSKYYPVVWTLHDAWPLCLTGWPPVPDCQGLNNNCHKCPTWTSSIVKINKFIKESVYKFSNIHIVSPSKWLASLLKNSYLGKQPLSVIYNGINPQLFYINDKDSIREELNLPQNKKIILFCGGKRVAGQVPAWRKGWQYLYNALQSIGNKYDNLFLMFVGDRLDIPKNFPLPIYFAEGISRNDMQSYYNASDLLVLPSLADHPALTILEAMACKLPVIATDTCGIPEAVIHNKTGLLCQPRNSIDLADKIEYLINNPVHAAQMAENGYRRFIDIFPFESMIRHYEDVYYKAIYSFHN